MNLLRTILLISALCLGAAESHAAKISFVRPSKAGEIQHAKLALTLSREYLFDLPGTENGVRKQETLTAVFEGRIKVLEVNQAGNPVVCEITPAKCGGLANGRSLDLAVLKDAVIHADMKTFPCRFTLGNGTKVSRDAQIFLASLFRIQPETSLSDTLGKEADSGTGKVWTPDSAPILDSLRARGFTLAKSDILASARIQGREKFNRLECVRITIEFETKKSIGIDFRLHAKITLPENARDGGVLKMERDGVEVVDRRVSSGEPAAEGTRVRVITKENMLVVLLPAAPGAEAQTPSFFNSLFTK